MRSDLANIHPTRHAVTRTKAAPRPMAAHFQPPPPPRAAGGLGGTGGCGGRWDDGPSWRECGGIGGPGGAITGGVDTGSPGREAGTPSSARATGSDDGEGLESMMAGEGRVVPGKRQGIDPEPTPRNQAPDVQGAGCGLGLARRRRTSFHRWRCSGVRVSSSCRRAASISARAWGATGSHRSRRRTPARSRIASMR